MINKREKINVRNERAITLIALVITIIVLLILAGISIMMLSGDNSILQKATESKETYDKARTIEQARVDILGKIAERKGANVTDTEVKEILDTYFEGVPNKLTDLTQTITTKEGRYEVSLAEVLNGVTVQSIVPKVSVADIKAAPHEFYGSEITNYTSENGYNTWKIFYADSSNIYIIASNHIEYDANLKGKGGTGHSFIQGSAIYNYKFGSSTSDGVIQDYPNGTDEIVDTIYETAANIKALNRKYFSTFPNKRTETNKIAIASMLDTTVWKGYMDKSNKTGKAKYAIGGPTIEMLFNSYNEKKGLFNAQNKGKYQVDVPSEGTYGCGYKISEDYGTSWNMSISNSNNYLDTTDKLYINGYRWGFWIASPSQNGSSRMIVLGSQGIVSNGEYNLTDIGFRPIVCLKAGTNLEKVENGKYKIVD